MKNSRAVVINSDMDHFSVLKEQVEDQEHDFYGSQSSNQIENSKAFSFSATGKLAGDYDIQLIGHFNQENAVAAGLACLRLGASLEDIKKRDRCNPRSWTYGSSHSEKWSQGLHRLCPQW